MSTSSQYQREPELGDGLRLHLNENTGGCSPKVIEALRALSPMDTAIYPDYGRVNDVCARHLDVEPSRLLLTNGLDEGILAAAIAYLQRDPGAANGGDAGRPEGLIAEPCFGMYADCIEAVGGRIVRVAPPADLAVSARRHAGRDHAAHARHLPDQPGQPHPAEVGVGEQLLLAEPVALVLGQLHRLQQARPGFAADAGQGGAEVVHHVPHALAAPPGTGPG